MVELNEAYVGIDCGGTKTTISIFRHDGLLLFESKYMTHSQYTRFNNPKDFCEHIHLFLELVRHQMNVKVRKPFLFVSLAVAGLNTKNTQQIVNKAYQEMFPRDAKVVFFTHDSVGAAYGVFPKESKCLVLVAGTGSSACLISKNEVLAKRGGNGYLIDDKGSAFDISNNAFKLLTKYFETLDNFEYLRQISPNISVHEYVHRITGYTYDELKSLLKVMNSNRKIESLDDIFSIYYPFTDPSVISSFAEAISSSARSSVHVCMKLLRQCADDLANMVLDLLPIYVRDTTNNEYVHKRCVVNLVCFGSFINNFNIMKYDFFSQLNKYHDPDSIFLRMVCVNDIGAYGAALYGLVQYNQRFRDCQVERPKVKPRETIDVYSGPLSKSPRFP